MYAAPSALRADAPNRLRLLGEAPGIVTDGAFFPDGRHLLLRNYGRAFVLAFPSLDLVGSFDLPAQKQGEGIAVAPDGSVYVSSEGVRSPVLRIAVPDEIAEAMSSAGSGGASSGSDDGTAGANGSSGSTAGSDRLRRRRSRCRPPRRQRAPAQRLALARRVPVPRHRPGRPDPRPPPPLTRPFSG